MSKAVQSDFLSGLSMGDEEPKTRPWRIVVTARAFRTGTGAVASTASAQIDFLTELFDGDAPQNPQPLATITVRLDRRMVERYKGLSDIPADEWDDYFPKTGAEWTDEDREYLVQWWGKDDVMSLSYALERPPWNLQREICKLRKQGVEIGYLRKEREKE